MVFIGLAVPARTGTDPSLERSPPEDLPAADRQKSVTPVLLIVAQPCALRFQKHEQKSACPSLRGEGWRREQASPRHWEPLGSVSWREATPALGWVPGPPVSLSPGAAPCSFLMLPASAVPVPAPQPLTLWSPG